MKTKTLVFPQIALVVLILVTLACGSSNSGQKVGEAMPTATKIAFSKIDVQGILIQPGDLPSNYEAGQIKYDWPTDVGLPMKVKPDNFILQMFKEKGDSFNIPHFSMLALYDNKNDADTSYYEIM